MKKRGLRKSGPILIPVDFSPYSVAALAWAATLCERLEERMVVLHVVHDPASAPGYYLRAKRKKHLRRIEEAALEMMQEFLAEMARDHPSSKLLRHIEPVLVSGLPVTRILEVAAELKASMIVMGSQGRTGLPHLLLGSKAERVAQLSPIPVTLVKMPKDQEPRARGES